MNSLKFRIILYCITRKYIASSYLVHLQKLVKGNLKTKIMPLYLLVEKPCRQ